MENKVKLQKLLQDIGYDNRRNIRSQINHGEFTVNSQQIDDPNFMVDPEKDKILHQGKKINLRPEQKRYFIFYKPDGVMSTLSDPEGRVSLSDYINKIKERVYPVGRLDFHSEGLILLTNDGDLTNFIISPKNQIPKVYMIKVKGLPSNELQKKMRTTGVVVDRVRIKPLQVDFIKKTGHGNSWLRVTIIEGKKHIVRKLFKYSGHPVEKLKRVAIGTFRLGSLKPGFFKEVDLADVERFKKRFQFK